MVGVSTIKKSELFRGFGVMHGVFLVKFRSCIPKVRSYVLEVGAVFLGVRSCVLRLGVAFLESGVAF